MPYVETTTGNHQCSYHAEWSTVDQIFNIRQILEKCSEQVKDTHHLFIDFKAVYDSIDRRSLYAAMEEFNIPKKLIALVKATMNNTQCQVMMQNKLSELINVTNGGRQGDALACLLFNIALQKVIREAAVNTRDTIQISAFTTLEKAAKGMNLFINQEKTKCMPVTKKSHANYPHYLEAGPYKFQVVHSFTYLGSDVNCNNDISAEIQKRILVVNKIFTD
jgi:sorting nexin-29